MKKQSLLKFLTLFLLSVTTISCSSESDNDLTQNDANGKITIKNKTYDLKSLVYNEFGNTKEFTFFNVPETDINSNEIVKSDYLRVLISYVNDQNIQTGTVLNVVARCEISLIDVNKGTVNSEEFLLYDSGGSNPDLLLETSEMTINNLQDNMVTLNFNFKRADGTTITGNYNGEL
ncbi:hypothetical protein [uncultured Tenacibaculum sp.]|uniref:hypothetical protein n=1 Tax=uncultured Tenacibaculum sp. TaxID=174713 RepID=UPI002606F684|nr:hypothetical protein [uncultured Tenacibaculum sp.]